MEVGPGFALGLGIQVLVDRFAYAAKLFGLTVSLKKAEVMHPSYISYTPEKRTPSGELRHGSSLHAGFYDLILFFPLSSFILTLDRCV